MCVHACKYKRIYPYLYIYICTYIYSNTHKYACMYVYVYIHVIVTYLYLFAYIHIIYDITIVTMFLILWKVENTKSNKLQFTHLPFCLWTGCWLAFETVLNMEARLLRMCVLAYGGGDKFLKQFGVNMRESHVARTYLKRRGNSK